MKTESELLFFSFLTKQKNNKLEIRHHSKNNTMYTFFTTQALKKKKLFKCCPFSKMHYVFGVTFLLVRMNWLIFYALRNSNCITFFQFQNCNLRLDFTDGWSPNLFFFMIFILSVLFILKMIWILLFLLNVLKSLLFSILHRTDFNF